MLIEQVIEFKLRGTTGYFHDKTKVCNDNLRLDCYLLLKILQEEMYLTFPYMGQIASKI